MLKETIAPLIGVSDNYANGRHDLRIEYTSAVYECGGAPVIIPYNNDKDMLEMVLMHLDGMILTGGGDLNPKLWGEDPIGGAEEPNNERDSYDLAIVEICKKHDIPIFAICRGHQVVNVSFGGSLFQDLPLNCGPSYSLHQQEVPTEQTVHDVLIMPNSFLGELVGEELFSTNSHHHQGINALGEGLYVSGITDDGVIEAIESVEYDILGVQFHPERMIHTSERAKALFENWMNRLKKK